MCSGASPTRFLRSRRSSAAGRSRAAHNFHSQHLFEHIYCAANLIIKNTKTECLFTLCDTARRAAERRSRKLDGKRADGDGEDESDECLHLPVWAQIGAVGKRRERR